MTGAYRPRLFGLLRCEQPRDADVDVGAHRVPQAPDLRRGDAELFPETDTHGAFQLVAAGGEPAHRRRAVHVVGAWDRLERHAGDEVEPQQVPVALGELPDGVAQRLLHQSTVLVANQALLLIERAQQRFFAGTEPTGDRGVALVHV